MTTKTKTPQTAVWYFIGATFIFISPTLFFPDVGMWLPIASLALGLLVFTFGAFVFFRELGLTRTTSRPTAGPADPETEQPT